MPHRDDLETLRRRRAILSRALAEVRAELSDRDELLARERDLAATAEGLVRDFLQRIRQIDSEALAAPRCLSSMPYRDDLDALRVLRDTVDRELAAVREQLAAKEDLLIRERELSAALEEVARDSRPQLASSLLRVVDIASPCPERWDEMIGDDRKRHCVRCRKDVFDLSAMPAADAEALLRSHNFCVRIFRRADGTVMTSDCEEGARLRRRRKAFAAPAPIAATVLGDRRRGREGAVVRARRRREQPARRSQVRRWRDQAGRVEVTTSGSRSAA